MFRVTHASRSLKHEDRYFVRNVDDAHVLVIMCDGHGGAYVAEQFTKRLTERLLHVQDHDEMYFEFTNTASFLASHTCGCAATVVLIRPTSVLSLNVGDVEAKVLPERGPFFNITTSHSFNHSASERKRALSDGATHIRPLMSYGRPVGSLRGWPGGLAMGRSIGDADCPFVRHTPERIQTDIHSGSFVVIASDGFWNGLSLRKIEEMLRSHASAEKMVEAAWRRRQEDDISCVVVSVGVPSPTKRRGWLGRRSDSNSSVSSVESVESDTEAVRYVVAMK